jgi:hypothetical protein
MGDYSSTGIWNYDDGIMIDYDTLIKDYNIPKYIIDRLEKWVMKWDSQHTTFNFLEFNNYGNKKEFYKKILSNNEKNKINYLIIEKIIRNNKNFKELRKEQYLLGKILNKYFDKVYIFDDFPLIKDKYLTLLECSSIN